MTFCPSFARERGTKPSETSLKQFPSRVDFIGFSCTARVGVYPKFPFTPERSSVRIGQCPPFLIFPTSRKFLGSIDRRPEARLIRDEYRSRSSLAIPDSKTIERLCGFGPLLEIGAGKGYWSWELRRAGVDVVATDPTGKGRYWKSGHWREPWIPLEQLDAIEAIRKYPSRSLLSVWPDRGRDWPSRALRVYRGDLVLYVGEGPGGCTANYDFHRILHDEFTCAVFSRFRISIDNMTSSG